MRTAPTVDVRAEASTAPGPVLVCATPGPDAARVACMLGNHPEALALPELQLGLADRYAQLETLQQRGGERLADGWLRAIAEIRAGRQEDADIAAARLWLKRRRHWSLAALLAELSATVARHVVLPDSRAAWRVLDLERALAAVAVLPSPSPPPASDKAAHAETTDPQSPWPEGGRLLHLVAHPWTDCARMAQTQREALFVASDYRDFGPGHDRAELDPQLAWLRIHHNLCNAGDACPSGHYRRLDLHRLQAAPRAELRSLCQWLGWRADEAVLDVMQHPQRSPFARRGPPSAPLGQEEAFLRQPRFTARLRPPRPLDEPLPWRSDDGGFCSEVMTLARTLGVA